MRRSSRSERCSTYQTSSSIRSGQESDARPFTCAQPVSPGLTSSLRRWRSVVAVDLRLDRRPRSDDRHLPAQDVHEVRQLVERVAAQQRADSRDARIVGASATSGPRSDAHPIVRSLYSSNGTPSLPDPPLAEQRRPARLEPDGDHGHEQQRRRKRKRQPAAISLSKAPVTCHQSPRPSPTQAACHAAPNPRDRTAIEAVDKT